MSETAVVNAATTKAAKAASAAAENLPAVTEAVETALGVAKSTNTKLVVTLSVAAGTALGAGVLYGVQKYINRNKVTVEVPATPEKAEKVAKDAK